MTCSRRKFTMRGSKDRVRALLRGDAPDRPPLYDLLRCDAVVAHFAGEKATEANGPEVVFRAYEPAIDATRALVRTPNAERTETLPDGRQQRFFRWTIWTSPRNYGSADAYASEKRRLLSAFDPAWNPRRQAALDERLENWRAEQERLGEIYYFLVGPCEWITSLYHEVGLDTFVYYMSDMPDLVDELLELATVETVSWAEHLPAGLLSESVFLADDIAFKTGPLFNPRWLRRHFMPRLARITGAFHKRGMKVLFHSDGNLNRILGDLVDAGIDGLNPIEIMAGMNVGEIHRRHPHLFLAGGIDVSDLLPFGTPEAIRDTVRRTIDEAEGRIMIGSSTELHDAVPLENFLAMRDAVLEYA